MIWPLPPGVTVKLLLDVVVTSAVAPVKVRPVDPMDLLVRVCVWFAKTKVSLAESAGIVAVLFALGAVELIVVVFVVPRTSWLVVLVNVSAPNVGVAVESIFCGSERVTEPVDAETAT